MLKRDRLVLAVTACGLLLAAALTAQESDRDKFQVHGFLTQAYADASFAEGGVSTPLASELTLGIPEDGTTDYRFLALQFRYEITDKDIVIVQLSSRRLGDSPIQTVEDEIELDWAFYERRLTENTSLKVGRVQIPLGIFNEIRDVGTILPFYRPSFVFYSEGSFTSETVDGILLSHTFFSETDWSLDADVYYGEFDLIEATSGFAEAPAVIARAEDAYGGQLWLNTPVLGLRFGAGFQQRDVTEGLEGVFRPVDGASDFDDYWFSVDAVFNKWVARAEWREIEGVLDSPLFGFVSTATQTNSYAQLGYHFTDKIRLYVQAEYADIENVSSSFTRPQEFDDRRDYGIALNYLFSPNVVAKLEYHEYSDETGILTPVFTPGGLRFEPGTIGTTGDGNYSILSLAVSF
ncbi:MAG: hypothetical protein AAGC60_30155 [Acidobacteriota bacterium]